MVLRCLVKTSLAGIWGKYPRFFGRICPKGLSEVGNFQRRNIQMCMKDYKSVRVAVMICATLVNTHTQTAFDPLYY